jgi:hypothetical protein
MLRGVIGRRRPDPDIDELGFVLKRAGHAPSIGCAERRASGMR